MRLAPSLPISASTEPMSVFVVIGRLTSALSALALSALALAVLSMALPCHAQRDMAEPGVGETLVTEERPVRAMLRLDLPEGVEGCPDVEAIAAGVELRLRREVFDEEHADVRVSAAITPTTDEHFLVQLTLRSLDGQVLGTRELLSQDGRCASLTDSLPLIIALLIDLQVDHIRLLLPTPAAVAPPEPVREPFEPHGSADEYEHTPQADAARVELYVGALGSVSLLPDIGIGATIGAGLRLPVGVSLELGFQAQTEAAPRSGPGGHFTMGTGFLAVCPSLETSNARFGLCVGGSGGFILGQPNELDYGADVMQPYGDAQLWARADLKLNELVFLRLDLGLAIPFTHDGFYFLDAGAQRVEVHQLPIALPWLRLAVGLMP